MGARNVGSTVSRANILAVRRIIRLYRSITLADIRRGLQHFRVYDGSDIRRVLMYNIGRCPACNTALGPAGGTGNCMACAIKMFHPRQECCTADPTSDAIYHSTEALDIKKAFRARANYLEKLMDRKLDGGK